MIQLDTSYRIDPTSIRGGKKKTDNTPAYQTTTTVGGEIPEPPIREGSEEKSDA